MQILQLGPYPPPEGGVSRNMLAIRDELESHGHQCSIIATSKSTNIIPDENVYRPNTSSELVKLLKKLDYDVLHLHVGGDITKRVLGLIAVCAFYGRGKSVLTVHSGGYPFSKEGQNAKRTSIRAQIFRRFGRIVAVNPLIAEVFKKYGISEEKIRVVYPFNHKNPDKSVEIPQNFKKFAKQHEPFLLTVGGLEDLYDLPVQIEALGEILNGLPNAGLMIVGSGVLENDLQQTISRKSYAGKILLAGNVPHETVLHLINACDILLRTTKFDGDAIAVREALFLETPVIATDNKMRPDGVHTIPVGDVSSLANKIREILKTEKKIKQKKIDDSRNIIEIIKIYEEILR